jgi:hypothetical protein
MFDEELLSLASAICRRRVDAILAYFAFLAQMFRKHLDAAARDAVRRGENEVLDTRFVVLLSGQVHAELADRPEYARRLRETANEVTHEILTNLYRPRAERYGWQSWDDVRKTVRDFLR